MGLKVNKMKTQERQDLIDLFFAVKDNSITFKTFDSLVAVLSKVLTKEDMQELERDNQTSYPHVLEMKRCIRAA